MHRLIILSLLLLLLQIAASLPGVQLLDGTKSHEKTRAFALATMQDITSTTSLLSIKASLFSRKAIPRSQYAAGIEDEVAFQEGGNTISENEFFHLFPTRHHIDRIESSIAPLQAEVRADDTSDKGGNAVVEWVVIGVFTAIGVAITIAFFWLVHSTFRGPRRRQTENATGATPV